MSFDEIMQALAEICASAAERHEREQEQAAKDKEAPAQAGEKEDERKAAG